MLALLQALLSFPTVLVIVPALGLAIWRVVKFIRRHPTILLGCCQLLQSPSGVFGLLTLWAVTIVTLRQPTVGGMAFAAFVSIVPAILSWTEHKEAMAGVNNPPPPPILVGPGYPPGYPQTYPPFPSPGTIQNQQTTVVVEPPPPVNPAKPDNNPTTA